MVAQNLQFIAKHKKSQVAGIVIGILILVLLSGDIKGKTKDLQNSIK